MSAGLIYNTISYCYDEDAQESRVGATPEFFVFFLTMLVPFIKFK